MSAKSVALARMRQYGTVGWSSTFQTASGLAFVCCARRGFVNERAGVGLAGKGKNMKVTDDEFKVLQLIFNLSRARHPPTDEIRESAWPLVERGLIAEDENGGLIVPDGVQQNLAAHGRLLKTR